MDNDGFTLAGQLVNQQSNAPLVFTIGSLKIRDFVSHDQLELAGTNERTLDAFPHRGGFSPNRLRKGYNLLSGNRLRFNQPDSHLRHGVGDEPHFMRTPRHQSRYEKKGDRADKGPKRKNWLRRE